MAQLNKQELTNHIEAKHDRFTGIKVTTHTKVYLGLPGTTNILLNFQNFKHQQLTIIIEFFWYLL